MRPIGRHDFWIVAGLVAVAMATMAGQDRRTRAADPLSAEIQRWSARMSSTNSASEFWVQAKQVSEPMLAGAAQALRDGRRLLALRRLAAARENLAAADYLIAVPAGDVRDLAKLEAEWKRMGLSLGRDVAAPAPAALSGVQPAAIRALGEAALSQVHVYYDASLDYGRNTTPDSGFYYLGVAQAQEEFAALCRTLSASSPSLGEPPLRALGPELDALESELLAAYRPPAAIDKHREFILASATLKEARELDALGLRHGALLRYLQAAQRLTAVRPSSEAPDAAVIETKIREQAGRFDAAGMDHTLGRLFLEEAQADLAAPGPLGDAAAAAAIVRDVLPRYFAALEPARPAPPRPVPALTVTLVRWPYT